MHPRARELITTLNLKPHPEGGYFAETYRARTTIKIDQRTRTTSTAIYFLLCDGQVSRWHAVDADEAWHHYEGDLLELWVMDPQCTTVRRHLLGRHDGDQAPQFVVPAGYWQAARPLGAYTLVGCTVSPGFEFADFRLLANDPDRTENVRRLHSEHVRFL